MDFKSVASADFATRARTLSFYAVPEGGRVRPYSLHYCRGSFSNKKPPGGRLPAESPLHTEGSEGKSWIEGWRNWYP